MWADFRNNMASRTNFDLRKLPQLHERLIENSKRDISEYDIIAINAPWLGEAVKKNLVIPLDSHIKAAAISPLDFHPSVWSMGTWRGQQFRIPDLLHHRTAGRGEAISSKRTNSTIPTHSRRRLRPPNISMRRPKEAVRHRPGTVGRGMPIASTFMFLIGLLRGNRSCALLKSSLVSGSG